MTIITSTSNAHVYIENLNNAAKWPGAVEYTDCISVERQDTPRTSVLNVTLNNLMEKFQ